MIRKEGQLRKTIQNLTEKTQGLFISILILAVLLIIAACFIPRVYQLKNLENLLRTYAPGGIAAVGLSLVILTGEIDVSVGAIMTLSMAVAAKIYDLNEPAAIAAICGTGIAAGFLNGYLITRTRVPSLMLTIGTTSVFNGLAAILVRAQKKYITDLYQITLSLAKGSIFGIPIPLLVCVILALAFEFVLRKSAFGKQIYYTGANKRASWMSGVDIGKVKIICFTASGLCAAIAALLMAGQLGSSTVQLGNGYEVTAISIAVLGGISLNGGKGTVIGTLLGFITMSLMQNMLAIAGLGTYVSTTLKGVMIILVVYLYGLTVRRRA
ncbi:ABC transporter permease [Enterocloster sp. OA13]|uniref:ABC transporter permease n=1 Tax=Enterocloster sp. OA13 TaxID=2914161 RepID=UPI001F06B95C|nr:ABC transporter permease [Enterocloster sp. OA13]